MVEPITVLVVDDEPLVRQGLVAQLRHVVDVRVVGEAADGLAAVASIEQLRPQLLFLDVQMPELDGFQVLQQIDADALPVVVFVTAFDRYALRAFEVHAVDYLQKPFDQARLAAALARARQWLQRGAGPSLPALLDDDRRQRGLTSFCARSGDRLRALPAIEVEWLEAAGNYVRLHHACGEFLVRCTLQQCEQGLDPRLFVRVHRSAIVNLDAVVDRRRMPGGDFTLRTRCGSELTLSRTRRAVFEEVLAARQQP